ncbi:DUF4404 family protein [Ketobacter sp. MCCC 1A13808]|uniref:DUF4404 family protein n=1 Tax=Ketobacter sp. MCCC 1A13808 TaxID=2602738 RepID=UPI000F230F92|nr:DUF4404 family protein [Ketobacter sp. MCCC 1A13808]MVF10912.1 DUF4404 family protein [Ketobacter sp. MCCC 1A13808]RLP56304.1 MAG: DUF4404 family protein [Ketobacter sp.]
MPQDSLKDAVAELRSRLDKDGQFQAEDKEALHALAVRVELMMNESREHWEEGVMDELEKRVIQYEEEHPVMARVISQIITTLNGIGL